jgi:hypothetical protein
MSVIRPIAPRPRNPNIAPGWYELGLYGEREPHGPQKFRDLAFADERDLV